MKADDDGLDGRPGMIDPHPVARHPCSSCVVIRSTLSIVLLAGIAAAACASTRRTEAAADGRYFHLLDRVDAWNLALAPDGVYVVDVHGCDFFGTMCGRWQARGDDVVLLPATGAERMWWPGSEGRSIVDVITLRATPDGYAASGTDGETAIAQTWARGRVCPNCETGGRTVGSTRAPRGFPIAVDAANLRRRADAHHSIAPADS